MNCYMGLPGNKPLIQEPAFAAPDQVLWYRFRAGDRQVFSNLYRQHVQALYTFGLKVTDDAQLVEDCIQELFIYLWKHRHKLGDTDSIRFYLFKSLRRRIVSAQAQTMRQSKKKAGLTNRQDLSEFSYEQLLVLRQVEEEQQQKLTHSLNALPKRQKEAIMLRYYHNLSFQEIAKVMSLTIKSTYNLIAKAIEALKAKTQVLAACRPAPVPKVASGALG